MFLTSVFQMRKTQLKYSNKIEKVQGLKFLNLSFNLGQRIAYVFKTVNERLKNMTIHWESKHDIYYIFPISSDRSLSLELSYQYQ